MNIVIMAGGGGTRLWPLSRVAQPKQFQKLFGDQSLLAITRMRLNTQYDDASVFYAATRTTAPLVKDTFPNLADDHLFIEPEKRDTGPAIGFVCALLALTQPDEPVAFMSSDHYVEGFDAYLQVLAAGESLVRETGKLVDVGLQPEWPNTELGYTKIGKQMETRDGVDVFAFAGHAEKPQHDTAVQYIASKEYLWHVTPFMWTPRAFLDAYKQHAPEMYKGLLEIQKLWKEKKYSDVDDIYATLQKTSVDYAVIEKLAHNDVLILKATYGWSDVGLWGALKRLREENTDENVIEGAAHVGIDTKDCLVYGPEKKLIATIGVENLVIVDTGDALLICDKNRSDEVKRLVEELKEQGRKEYL